MRVGRDAAQRSLRRRIEGGGGNEQTGNEALEVETAIETPSSLAEVTFGVLEVTKSVEGAIERAFEVSHHHVDPARAIGFGTRLASARLDYGMGMIEKIGRASCRERVCQYV